MRRCLKKWALCSPILAAVLGLAKPAARAEESCFPPRRLPDCVYTPETGTTGQMFQPGTSEAATDIASLSSRTGGAGIGSSVELAPGAYIDSAIPRTMFRLRYDAGFDMNRPDRAEFFYASWRELSFHPHGIMNDGTFKGVFFDPKARGPEQLPGRLDFQEVSPYLEFAFSHRLSGFVEVPTRFVDFDNLQEDPDHERFPEPRAENTEVPHNNVGGLSDIQAGFKAALIADPDRYLTFQFRTYIPTGDAGRGLGTGHTSLEPGILLYERLSERLALQGQFKDWVPIGGGPGAGNVLIYGFSLGYDVYQHCDLRITPVAEMVGWTVLSGFESFAGPVTPPAGVNVPTTHGVMDASGDTIVNAKIGVRTYFGRGQDVYVGWGRSLTGDRWYKDLFRVEYRIGF